MDGVNIDLPKWCGLSDLSDEEYDHLWNNITELNLLEECETCEVIETGEIDEVPGQSDVFFKVVTDELDLCRKEVMAKIKAILGDISR